MSGTAKIEKRNRPPKSCEPCRTRKNERRTDKGASVAERLKHLEGLLTIVAEQRDPLSSLSIKDTTSGKEESVSTNTSIYDMSRGGSGISGLRGHVDSSHWSSILENIKAIREELPSDSPPDRNQISSSNSPGTESESQQRMSPDLDFGSSAGLEIKSILAALPPRHICDTLISTFFRWHYSMLPILHPVKFQREYERFWNAPTETPTIWIALLFALLSLSAGVYEASSMASDTPSTMPPSKVLSENTQQCLLLSNYITCQEHAVETFLLHLVGRWLRAKASDTNLWFLMGKVVQLALCKGYHRDSSKIPNADISPFDGEMRRRVWLCIYQLDALMSFQLGLPSMVPSDSCDAELPRNLDQNQLHPDITELSPSRPFSENTTILYSIVKASVMAKFKEVVKHTQSPTPPSHETTASLDAEVRQAYNNIPDHFKYKPLTNFLTEEVSVIVTRTTMELLHLKSIIVLHRQHLMYRHDRRSDFSRKACLEAATRLLERQAEMDRVTETGGQLHDMKWMITTLTLSDFTLAAMIICLDLTVTIRYGVETLHSSNPQDEVHRYLAVIQNAHRIWVSAGEKCAEARMVSHALDSTIQRVNEFMSTWSLSTGPESWQSFDLGSSNTLANDSTSQLHDLDMMDIIDWTLIDNQFQDANVQEFDLDMWLMETAGPLEAGV
ncbi:transcription factor [Fusarium longipes]|uniref:Transcription factor n=1 Tax=Fusarium longipes TaxID=694270 RepID=A0A395T3I7_9HYPO|nr:transcription factor [Fusarium longipes]